MLGAERALHLCGGQVECRTAWHARVHARATPQPARGFERDARRAARRGARGAVSRGSPSGAEARRGARSRVRRNSKKCFVFRFLAEPSPERACDASRTPRRDPVRRGRAGLHAGLHLASHLRYLVFTLADVRPVRRACDAAVCASRHPRPDAPSSVPWLRATVPHA